MLQFHFKHFFLFTADTAQAPKPFVNDTLAQHKTVGDHFQLNCSASYSGQTLIHLSWFVPNPEGIDVNIFIFN